MNKEPTVKEQLYLTYIKLNKDITIKELQGYLNKDRTTIQKTLSIMINKGIIKREQYNQERGFNYLYSIK